MSSLSIPALHHTFAHMVGDAYHGVFFSSQKGDLTLREKHEARGTRTGVRFALGVLISFGGGFAVVDPRSEKSFQVRHALIKLLILDSINVLWLGAVEHVVLVGFSFPYIAQRC
eukprot:m.262643 g.262643  ORF g.262643 m.262643 type:complete len:114 (-) comp26802_c0_seq3:1857-2198(-)